MNLFPKNYQKKKDSQILNPIKLFSSLILNLMIFVRMFIYFKFNTHFKRFYVNLYAFRSLLHFFFFFWHYFNVFSSFFK